MDRRKRLTIAYIAIFLVPMSGLAIDIYTPALPIIRTALGTTAQLAKLTVSLYILGFGLSQLAWGPLSDQYGRKKTIAFGLYLFLLATLPLLLVKQVTLFLGLRTIQGIAVGAINTGARTVIIDLFEGEEFKKYINICTIAWSLSPIIAPIIGSELIHLFNWKACFFALASYSLAAIILVHFFVVETNLSLKRLCVSTLKNSVVTILRTRDYLAGLFLVILSYSSLTVFYVLGPFIIQNTLHHSQRFYAHCAAMVGSAWLLGNVITKYFTQKGWGLKTSTVVISMASCCILAHLLLYFLPLLVLFMVFLFCYVVAAACIFPRMFAHCLSFYKNMAGIVSAITGAGFWFFGGVASIMASMINISVALNIFLTYSAITLLLILTYLFFVPSHSEIKCKS